MCTATNSQNDDVGVRVIYIDIDSLRADHLGCYGHHRNTSPNIDRLAAEGLRFESVYVSDAPCLPSRTALWSGRFGFHTGVVNHGGTAARPFQEDIGWVDELHRSAWMMLLRREGIKTVTVSQGAHVCQRGIRFEQDAPFTPEACSIPMQRGSGPAVEPSMFPP